MASRNAALANHTDAGRIEMFNSFEEELQFDMRGTMSLVGNHGTISCGEAKSSSDELKGEGKAFEQSQIRTKFLQHAVDIIFPNRFATLVRFVVCLPVIVERSPTGLH